MQRRDISVLRDISMYVCMYTCMYAYMYICLHESVYTAGATGLSGRSVTISFPPRFTLYSSGAARH